MCDIIGDSAVIHRQAKEYFELSPDKRCAPSKTYKDGSCISTAHLEKIIAAYNKTQLPENIIDISDLPKHHTSHYRTLLVQILENKLSSICSDQICWTKQSFMKFLDAETKNELLHNTFRPAGPKKQFEWLSTIDINKVVVQYESKHPEFKFLGSEPIDFKTHGFFNDYRDVNRLLNGLLKKGKTKCGLIINLDKHNQDGSHWVSLYFDLINGLVYFSDSNGIVAPPQIKAFMREIEQFIRQNRGCEVIVKSNRTRHQNEDSECGVYSINFILRLLNGESFENITRDKLPDRIVNKCRTVYFHNVNVK